MDARTRRINGIIERSTSNEKWPEGGRGGGRGSREEVKRERERVVVVGDDALLWWWTGDNDFIVS